jgi:hypothetical protein
MSWDQVPPEVMEEMRIQAKERDWRETEESGEDVGAFIDGKTDAEMLAHYESQWSGGIDGFMRDSGFEVRE